MAALPCIRLARIEDASALTELCVEPQWIRTGVGRALIAHAIGEARWRGAKRLTILSDPHAAVFTSATARVELVRRPPTPPRPIGAALRDKAQLILRRGD
jgi:GNAT superfamily N-acetyltransferase